MKSSDKLLLSNKAWAQEQVMFDKDYFVRMAPAQQPEFLWIGCSDSRVPANEVTATEPGDIFVHRNVANLALHNDLNVMSVLQYAVDVLKVNHVIVCGHQGCGGVRAAMTDQDFGLLNEWLRSIRETYRANREAIDRLPDEETRANALVELNVRAQVVNLANAPVIQNAWKQHKRPWIHGWVYRLADGIIDELIAINPDITRQ